MYGTVARMRIKPGNEQELLKFAESAADAVAGVVSQTLYRLDNAGNEYILVVGFEDRESYVANANSPEQHQRYLGYRELLESDPEWNDGEVIYSYPS
jgi:heme-degrading monooxygenase HmoA